MKKILVIDDNKTFCKIVKAGLEQSGEFQVNTANSSSEGVELAKKMPPDLILLDIVMPEKDGGETANILRDELPDKNIPIVFLTALVKKEEVKLLNEMAGKNYYLSKSIDIIKLLEYVRNLLQKGNP